MVCLLISGLLCALISESTKLTSKTTSKILKKDAEINKLNSAADILSLAISKNVFNQKISIHHWHTSIHLPEYISTRINSLQANHQADLNAAILEIAETLPSIFISSPTNNLRFIGEDKLNLIKGKIKAWLVPFPNSTFRIKHANTFTHLTKNIYAIELDQGIINSNLQILFNNTKTTINTPYYLVPLTDHYLLYTSKANTLRRISLLTSENQPLEENLSLKFIQEGTCELKLIGAKFISDKSINCFNTNTQKVLDRIYALDL